eukprot:GHVR01143868.1.p1 GENE.GHVR01143868.1~~GHVR01143868.1.p1  ORF type:complete len:946 (+),score=256.34 GHVR01143868.1:28-2865(+)
MAEDVGVSVGLKFEETKRNLLTWGNAHSLLDIAQGHKYFGIHHDKIKGVTIVREWLPSVSAVSITGDFCDWDREAHPLQLVPLGDTQHPAPWGEREGVWETEIPDNADGTPFIEHKCNVKLHIVGMEGNQFDRISPWTRLAWRTPHGGFNGVVWHPSESESYKFRHSRPQMKDVLSCNVSAYEVFVGAVRSDGSGTYRDVWEIVLPRMERLGCNCLILTGVQEHSDVASMGWDVTSFFAPTSRFGTPDELKELVDMVHEANMTIIVDLTLSHACDNVLDGMGDLTGSPTTHNDFIFSGRSPVFRSKKFEFSRFETLQFVLSVVSMWKNEFNVDGIRVLSLPVILYTHSGVGINWEGLTQEAAEYIGSEFKYDGAVCLKLINELLNEGEPCVSVAYDDSAHPLTCYDTSKGGLGFNFRSDGRLARTIRNLCSNGREMDTNRLVSSLDKVWPWDNLITAVETLETNTICRRPVRVAMFAWESLYTHPIGGVAPHVTELSASLARLGLEVHVFVRAVGDHDVSTTHHGVVYHQCSFSLCSDFVAEITNMCSAFVNKFNEIEGRYGWLFDVVHAHDWLAAGALMQLKRENGERMCVQTIHSTEYGRCGNKFFAGESERIRRLEAQAVATADMVICVSGVLAGEVSTHYSCPPEKIKRIYNGIHCNHFDFLDTDDIGKLKVDLLGVAPMDPVLLFVGRLALQKGPDLLIHATPSILSARADVKIVMVGDGHMMRELEQWSREHNVNHAIRFLGTRSPEQVRTLVKLCDAVIVPSRNEPFGIVVLEGWAAHKPVVATTSGGPRDFVNDGVDGYLVDPNVGSVAYGCCRVLSNFEHAKWMGSRGRVRAAFEFSWEGIGEETRDLYLTLRGKRDAPLSLYMDGGCSLSDLLMGGSHDTRAGVLSDDLGVHDGTSKLACIHALSVFTSGAHMVWHDSDTHTHTHTHTIREFRYK